MAEPFSVIMQSPPNNTIFISGATDGLGKALAVKFASVGHSLILHGRNKQKGESLVSNIISETKNRNISYYNADFASLSEVKQMCQEISKKHEYIDLLINNAAIGGGPKHPGPRELSKDGYELRFAVNYLSHFLVTNDLIPLLRNAKNSRVVFVSSIGQAPLVLNDLMMEKSYDSYTAYCRSKLAQIIYGFRLAEMLKPEGIMVNSVHPATLMPTNMVFEFFGRTASTIEEGVDAVSYVCCSNETVHVTGNYFNQKKKAKANAQAYDLSVREELWNISKDLIRN